MDRFLIDQSVLLDETVPEVQVQYFVRKQPEFSEGALNAKAKDTQQIIVGGTPLEEVEADVKHGWHDNRCVDDIARQR